MRQKIRHMEKVYNATFEKLTISIYSRYWTFEPRSYTEVDEIYIDPIEREHFNKGLIVIGEGDDFEEKEKQALMNYRLRLVERIRNYQSEMDESKKRGSVMEEQLGMRLAKKWLAQIDQRYSVESQLMQEDQSFLSLDKPKTDPVVHSESKRNPGRPKRIEEAIAI